MQEPTHILTGVIIQKCLVRKRFRTLGYAATAILALLSHGLLDKLADFTYHPANPDFHSVFWITYHSVLLVVTITFFYIWWRRYWWGILFACLPDLDWVIIHGGEIFGVKIPFYRTPHLHHFVDWFFKQVPALSFLDHLPNGSRHNPWAVTWEVVGITATFLAIRHFDRKQKSPASGA